MSAADYLRKINGLLRKAERTENVHEAEALTEKAEALMLKWGIDDAMLEAAGGEDHREAIVERMHKCKGRYHQAQMQLMTYVARGLGSLRVLRRNSRESHTTYVYVIGHESDVARAEMLWASLWLQANSALEAWWADYEGRRYMSRSEIFRARRQFLLSFGDAVSDRLARNRKQAEDDAAATTPGTALVLADRDRAVADWMDAKYSNLRSGRPLQGSYAGREAGRAAGQRANLGNNTIGTRKAVGQ